jgi:hypothetical protein
MARFEVLGRDADRELIRSLARRLADGMKSRFEPLYAVPFRESRRTKEALRRSPLVSADLDLKRPVAVGRRVNL